MRTSWGLKTGKGLRRCIKQIISSLLALKIHAIGCVWCEELKQGKMESKHHRLRLPNLVHCPLLLDGKNARRHSVLGSSMRAEATKLALWLCSSKLGKLNWSGCRRSGLQFAKVKWNKTNAVEPSSWRSSIVVNFRDVSQWLIRGISIKTSRFVDWI